MPEFIPDYKNIVNAAGNSRSDRIPFYEHQIANEIISKIMGKKIHDLETYDDDKLDEYFSVYC